MDKAYPFAIQNLIKIEISKMMALHDTLVDDSENWTTSTNFDLSFLLVCFMFVFDQNLAEHLHCDKGLLYCHHSLCAKFLVGLGFYVIRKMLQIKLCVTQVPTVSHCVCIARMNFRMIHYFHDEPWKLMLKILYVQDLNPNPQQLILILCITCTLKQLHHREFTADFKNS